MKIVSPEPGQRVIWSLHLGIYLLVFGWNKSTIRMKKQKAAGRGAALVLMELEFIATSIF